MVLNERHSAILDILKQNRTANVKELANRLFVSDATIRRDLREMQSLGLIERSHGGAILQDNAEEVSIFVRMTKNAKAKEQVATNAMPHIPEFHSVFIDSSSTALALAGRLDLSFKTVVTNNLQTALQLSKNPNVNLILLGGNVQFRSVSSTGSWTARQIEEFNFDLMLASCTAIVDGEVLERSLEQKEIKLAAYRRSKHRILLADRSKFSTDGTYRLASVEDFDLVVTD
ncbi:MAG: DeoR/GlpR transcriptional regulator [Clostridia bacterium]|nr:DeoR/GlpR transcriptional regulator [Clostridia bacterium]